MISPRTPGRPHTPYDRSRSFTLVPDREALFRMSTHLPLAFYDTDPHGAHAATPVVLGHGFALDHTLWTPQTRALRTERRVMRWDMPGHGSSSARERFTFWEVARSVLAHLDAHRLQRFVIGGLSQGGFVALRVALLAPERIAGLILADTEAHRCSDLEAQAYRELFGHLAAVGTSPAHTGQLAAQILGHGPAAEPVVAQWQQVWADRLPSAFGHPVDALIERDDLTDRLSEITAPTLLLRGSEDSAIPPERMQFLQQHLPGAGPVHTIHGAAHAPPLTHPEEVTALVRSFLAEIDDQPIGTP